MIQQMLYRWLVQCQSWYWLIDNSTPGNIFQWNFVCKSKVFIQENVFQDIVCVVMTILTVAVLFRCSSAHPHTVGVGDRVAWHRLFRNFNPSLIFGDVLLFMFCLTASRPMAQSVGELFAFGTGEGFVRLRSQPKIEQGAPLTNAN